jgi:hypothetical protein
LVWFFYDLSHKRWDVTLLESLLAKEVKGDFVLLLVERLKKGCIKSFKTFSPFNFPTVVTFSFSFSFALYLVYGCGNLRVGRVMGNTQGLLTLANLSLELGLKLSF